MQGKENSMTREEIEQKAKAYDKAVDTFNVLLNLNTVKESGTIFTDDVRKIFPELKENEDEKIRKEIEQLIQCMHDADPRKRRWISWLEKQGETYEKLPQTSHKYNTGDCIVSIFGSICQIQEVMEGSYNLLCTSNAEEINSISFVDNNSRRLCMKDIQNLLEKQGEQKPARDYSTLEITDVVRQALQECEDYSNIRADLYAARVGATVESLIQKQGEQKSAVSDLRTWIYIVDAVLTEREGIGQYIDSPWTAEIADKLMKRFGTIEQKPTDKVDPKDYNNIDPHFRIPIEEMKPKEESAWSEEDEEMFDRVDDSLRYYRYYQELLKNEQDSTPANIISEEQSWLKSLKDRVLPQPKQEWSEQDEVRLNRIVGNLELLNVADGDILLKDIAWLKSLKNRFIPQPKQEWSKLDIEMIDWLIRDCEKKHEELCNDKYGHQEIVSDLKRDCRKKWDWLESLKNKVVPQNHLDN